MCARSAVGSAARLPSFVMVTGMTNRSEHLAEADDRWRQGVVVRGGARQNNLADVDLDVPRDRLVVFTGVSGSGGKSSLAFGTLFAESQRRYLESVAPYARRLIDQVGVPDVDVVEGLPPAVALQQHRGIGNARSNVASVTTLGSLVRMLYSRAGLTQMTNRCSTRRTSRRTPCRAHVRPAMHRARLRGRCRQDGPRSHTQHPGARDRFVAAGLAGWQPSRHPGVTGIRRRLSVEEAAEETSRLDPVHRGPPPHRSCVLGIYPGTDSASDQSRNRTQLRGNFVGARRFVLDTFANTKSSIVKKRVSEFVTSEVCPMCQGKRVKAEALSVTFEGLDIAEFASLPPLARLAEIARTVVSSDWLPEAAGEALDETRRAEATRRRVASEDRRTPPLPTCDAPRTCQRKNRWRRGACSTTSSKESNPSSTSGWDICHWTGRRPHSPAESCNDCAWRRSCPRSCSASLHPRRTFGGTAPRRLDGAAENSARTS